MNVSSIVFRPKIENKFVPKNEVKVITCDGAAIATAPLCEKVDPMEFAGLTRKEVANHAALGRLTKKVEAVDPIADQVAEMFSELELCEDELQICKGFNYNIRQNVQRFPRGFRNLENPNELN